MAGLALLAGIALLATVRAAVRAGRGRVDAIEAMLQASLPLPAGDTGASEPAGQALARPAAAGSPTRGRDAEGSLAGKAGVGRVDAEGSVAGKAGAVGSGVARSGAGGTSDARPGTMGSDAREADGVGPAADRSGVARSGAGGRTQWGPARRGPRPTPDRRRGGRI